MKTLNKLIPALCMLLVSAILAGTSTYAWFSMNKTVTANGMQVTATSANPYLLISEEESGTYDTAADAMILNPTASTALKLVTPLNVASYVQYYKDAADKAATSKTTPSKFTNAADVLWGTAISGNPAEVQADKVPDLVGGANLNNGDLANYVQISTLWFKVAAADQLGSNLKCSKVTFATGTNSISASGRVLLVSESGKYQLFKMVNGEVTVAETGSDSALIASVNGTAQKVTAYFYFDGTDDAAYTNNATDLTAVTVNFTFTID